MIDSMMVKAMQGECEPRPSKPLAAGSNPAALAIFRQTGANLKALILNGLDHFHGVMNMVPALALPCPANHGFSPQTLDSRQISVRTRRAL